MIQTRYESLSMNFSAYDRLRDVEVNPSNYMQLPIYRDFASLFLSLEPRYVTMRLVRFPDSSLKREQQCLMAWQVSLKGMVQGRNYYELRDSLSIELTSTQQKVSLTQKLRISLDFFSPPSSKWSFCLYYSRLASSFGTSAYRSYTISVNSFRYYVLSLLSLSFSDPYRHSLYAVTSVLSYPVSSRKLGNRNLVLSCSSQSPTWMNLGQFSIYSVACLAAADKSMKKPLIFLEARLSQKDLLMPLSPLGLQMQIAMMFLWLGDYYINFYELSMSATTLKKQLWIFRNFSAQEYDLQTGTSQSFYRWFLQSYCTCFMLSSLTSLPRMNSQITEALPDKNPLTIYIFRSLYLLSRSLNNLLSSFLSFSLFFRSLSLERDRDRSASLLTASDCSLGLRQEGMERQSQFSSLRQLFLLGIILILWMFHCAYSPFCSISSQDYSDYAFIERNCVFESSSATRMSIITYEFFRSLPLLPDSCMKFILGRSTQSSVVAPVVGFLVLGRAMRSLDASISYGIYWSLGATGCYWTIRRLLLGPKTLRSFPRACTFNILLRKPQLADCSWSAFIASPTIN